MSSATFGSLFVFTVNYFWAVYHLHLIIPCLKTFYGCQGPVYWEEFYDSPPPHPHPQNETIFGRKRRQRSRTRKAHTFQCQLWTFWTCSYVCFCYYPFFPLFFLLPNSGLLPTQNRYSSAENLELSSVLNVKPRVGKIALHALSTAQYFAFSAHLTSLPSDCLEICKARLMFHEQRTVFLACHLVTQRGPGLRLGDNATHLQNLVY